MAHVIMSRQSRSDLGEIVLERRRSVGFMAARALRERITSRIYRLREFPEIGRRLSVSWGDGQRDLIVPPYHVIYRLVDETVTVLTIINGRMMDVEMNEDDV